MIQEVLEYIKNNLLNSLYKIIIIIIFTTTVILLLFFHYYYDSPSVVFSRMLSNSLETSSYTKTIKIFSNTQTNTQKITLQLGSVNRVLDNQSLMLLHQNDSAINITSIALPNVNYSKYTLIKTQTRNSAGHLINYNPIVGIWGVNGNPASKATDNSLYNRSVLDIVPMANINPSQKNVLISYLNKYKVYDYSKKVKNGNINGRPVISYDVKINFYYLGNYVDQFANDIGLKQYKNGDNIFGTSGIERAQFMIDVLSGQLKSINFPGSKDNYQYSSYGSNQQINIPNKYIKLSKLENNIQKLSTK